MEFYNQGEYVSNTQLLQLYELMPLQMRKLPVDVCITKSYEFLDKNPNLLPEVKSEFEKMLNTQCDAAYYAGLVVVYEDRILERCFEGQFYWMFVYLLIHELRHCEQACYFRERWDIVMSDYNAGYGEYLLDNESLKTLHWTEQDAYTYCYRFVVNHKYRIREIFNIDDVPKLVEFNAFVDVEQVWESYRSKLALLPKIMWMIADIFWNRRGMSKQ
ncbi:TPA: hypothetical protein QCR51_004886 [Bacillus cereus]|nr:hypothetical protein [Bacillus cereus]